MTTENFQPNWASKTTRNRLNKIQSFAEDYFVWNDGVRRLGRDRKFTHFGQSSNELSKYFESTLLLKSGAYIPGQAAYEYLFSWNNLLYCFNKAGMVSADELDQFGFDELKLRGGLDRRDGKWVDETAFVIHKKAERKAKEFFDTQYLERHCQHLKTENAVYVIDEFTTRRKAKFQNTTTSVRAKFWSGWYDYDIQACSYTLLHQHLINTVLPWWGPAVAATGKEDYSTIEQVYLNKNEVRAKLADELGISVELVKKVLASILFDAKLSRNPYSDLYKKLVKRHGVDADDFYDRAAKSEFIQKLIKELRSAWPKLMYYWNRQNSKNGRKMFVKEHTNLITGQVRRRFAAARFRSRIYFELERKVMDVCLDVMGDIRVRHVMHDGFFTRNEVDIELIKREIEDRTGFVVKFDVERLGDIYKN